MTRNQLVKSIVEETGYDKEMVANVLESFEYKVMDAIATEDTLQFAFGKFWGETKDPYKITGFYSTFEKIRALEGWSQAKLGYPHFKFSKQALICLKVRPREYFEQPENRYTSLARKFRKDLNIPEIAEYKDLPEEKIEELCKQADVEKHGEISSSRARFLRRHNNWNKKRDAARDEIKAKILIDEDLQKQRDNGVAEEDLVVRPIEEIKADKEKEWIAINEQFKKDNADWLREREERYKKHYYKVQEREAQKTAEREERFSQLRKENLGEDYLDELDNDYEDLN